MNVAFFFCYHPIICEPVAIYGLEGDGLVAGEKPKGQSNEDGMADKIQAGRVWKDG